MSLRVSRQQAKVLQLRIDGGADDITPRRRRNVEQEMQEDLFARVEQFAPEHPALGRLFATLNGVFLTQRAKDLAEAAGMRRGVLDLWLPVARAGYHGLAMDIKSRTGRPSRDQLEWARWLSQDGWLVSFPGSSREAWRTICCYLDIAGRAHSAPDWWPRDEMEN